MQKICGWVSFIIAYAIDSMIIQQGKHGRKRANEILTKPKLKRHSSAQDSLF